MKPKAFLVYGSEERHRNCIFSMALYLKEIGCSVQVCSVSNTGFWKKFDAAISSLLPEQTFLITHLGHGNLFGWESDISYRNISNMLSLVQGKVVLVNYTCYGAKAIEHLEKRRNPNTTSFLAPCDADANSYATPALVETLSYWRQGKTLDEVISKVVLCGDEEDIDLPVQIRWGAKLDSLFFPTVIKQ